MAGIGHNQGPTMERGGAWRRYAWGRARTELLPKLPLEVVRMRVRRARELGIDYKAYASIRAASGHDVVALLFSSNALRLLNGAVALPADRQSKLTSVRYAKRWALVHAPTRPEAVQETNPEALDWAAKAPALTQSRAQTSDALRTHLATQRTAGDRVVLIGDTALEREWLAAGRLAGYIPAERYFGAAP